MRKVSAEGVRWRAGAAYDRGFNGEVEEKQLDGVQSRRLARLWEGRYRVYHSAGLQEDQ